MHTDNLYCFCSARWITRAVLHCNNGKCGRITFQKGDCEFDFSVYQIQNILTLKPSYHCFICWHKSDSEPKTFPDINKSQTGVYPAEYLSSCDLSPAIHWLSHFECASAEMCTVVWVLKAVAVAARLSLRRLIASFLCVCVCVSVLFWDCFKVEFLFWKTRWWTWHRKMSENNEPRTMTYNNESATESRI